MKSALSLQIARCAGQIVVNLLLLVGLPAANAATYTWTGAGFFGNQDYLWSNPHNWAGLAAPAPGEANVTLVFPNNNAPKVTTNDIVGLSVSAIQFLGSNYVVHGKPAGNALTLHSTSLAGWVVIASYNGNYFASTSPLVLSNSGTVGVASGATLSVLSGISGPGGITKISPGTLKFAAGVANTYGGTTTVTDGTLDLNNGTFIPSATYVAVPGPLVIGNTNMSLAPQVRLLLNDQIADTQPVMIYENGRLSLNGKNDTLGAITMRDGADISTGLGGGDSSPGVLRLNGNVICSNSPYASYASIRGRLDLGLFTRTFGVESWLRVYANISGNSIFNPGITKTGWGSLTLMNTTNSYTGETLIQQGTFHIVGGSAPLGSTEAGTSVLEYAELYLEGVNLGAEPLTLNGGGDITVLGFRGTNVCAGPVTLIGPCRISNAYWFGQEHDLTLSGAIGGTGSLRKTGTGKLRFTGFGGNTFTGGLYCEEGWTFMSKSASAPALSGPLFVGREGETGQWIFLELTEINQIPNHLPITLLDYGSLHTMAGVTETIGPVTLKGGLIYAIGTLTLAGNVTNQFSPNSIGYLTGEIALPATRVIHCEADSTLQASGNWAGPGGVTKTGAGELRFTHAHTYSGATLVQDGMLTLESNGRPGSSAAGTTVEASGTLYLKGASVTNEALVLHGGGNGIALAHHKTNVWSGPVEVQGGAILKAEPGAQLSILGAVSGASGLTHLGAGALILGGTTDNTFNGSLTFRQGTLQFSKSGAYAMPGGAGNSLVLGYPTNGAPPATVRTMAHNQFAPANGAALSFNSVTLNYNAQLDCNGFNQTIPNLNLLDATATTGTGVLTLRGNLTVANGSTSYVFGNLRLGTGTDIPHLFHISNNANLLVWGDLSESGGSQSIYKDGSGSVGTLGSNSFSGTLTVHQGSWLAGGSHPFGTADGPTIVNAGATLYAYTGTNSEPLTLAGAGMSGMAGALVCPENSTASFTGPITLATNAVIHTGTNALLTFTGVISGPGGFTKQGPGTMQLLGNNANTYTGPTAVTVGKLELGKTSAVAVPGPLTITGPNSSTYVHLLQPQQIGDLSPVTLAVTGWISLNGHHETIGSLAGVGAVFQSAVQIGTLTVGGNGDSTSFAGSIHGGGGLTKIGPGTLTLTGDNLFTGTTTINAGTLLVMGQQPQSPVSILTGGRLGGSGRVGHISDLNGHVAPGANVGILVCSNFSTFTPANLLEIEISGATPGSGHDQLHVLGNVLLLGGTLQVTLNTTGAIGTEYVIIRNDGPNPVTGSFTGLPEGAMLTNNGAVFQISYQGGDGNDAVLTQITPGSEPRITGGRILPDGSFQLDAQAGLHQTVQVEATTTLTPPILWTPIGSVMTDGTGIMQFTDPDAPQFPHRFYRLRLP